MSPNVGRIFVSCELTAHPGFSTSSIPEDGLGNSPYLEDDDPEPVNRKLSYRELQKLTRAEQVEYARNRKRGYKR